MGRPAYRLTRGLLFAGYMSSHCPKAGTLAFGQVSLQYVLSPEGAGGHAAAVSLRVHYLAFKPTQLGRRYVLWDAAMRSQEPVCRQAPASMEALK